MTRPILKPKRLFDEAARTRAKGINNLGKAYEEGSVYDDIDNTKAASDVLNAEKDYDTFSRIRPSRSLKHTRLPKRKG